MRAAQALEKARNGNAEWLRRPSPIPHTVFDQACINFVNSEFLDHVGSGRRYDRLVLPEWRAWFLRRCGVSAGGAITDLELTQLFSLRRRLRRLLENQTRPGASDIAELNSLLRATPMTWTLRVSRHAAHPISRHLAPALGGWRAAMGIVVVSYAELASSGALPRVKRCGNRHCCYLFFDTTKGATRRWCDPHACGNLVKVRRYRSRRRPS